MLSIRSFWMVTWKWLSQLSTISADNYDGHFFVEYAEYNFMMKAWTWHSHLFCHYKLHSQQAVNSERHWDYRKGVCVWSSSTRFRDFVWWTFAGLIWIVGQKAFEIIYNVFSHLMLKDIGLYSLPTPLIRRAYQLFCFDLNTSLLEFFLHLRHDYDILGHRFLCQQKFELSFKIKSFSCSLGSQHYLFDSDESKKVRHIIWSILERFWSLW